MNYGSSSSVFSNKVKYPSFLRTAHPNIDIVNMIVAVVQYFNWRWIAFLNSDNDFGNDGLDLIMKQITDTDICLGYTKAIAANTNYSEIFKNIEQQGIQVIIVFVSETEAEALIESAVRLNVTNKVWVASDTWSSNKRLMKMKGIKNIGTVLGISQLVLSIPGFNDFITSSRGQHACGNGQQTFCNQAYNYSRWSAQDIISADPSFTFPVYSAVYAIAHALHNILQCGEGGCNNITVYPDMVSIKL